MDYTLPTLKQKHVKVGKHAKRPSSWYSIRAQIAQKHDYILNLMCSFLCLVTYGNISLRLVAGPSCFPLSYLSSKRQKRTKYKLNCAASVQRRVDTHSASSFVFHFFIRGRRRRRRRWRGAGVKSGAESHKSIY